MKLTTFLLLSALLAPATMLLGLAGPVAFGLTTVFGLSAIMLADYGTPAHRGYHPAKVKAARTESHPFAA
jgi:hypothetical protein